MKETQTFLDISKGLNWEDVVGLNTSLEELKHYSRPRYSGFRVAAVVKTKEGETLPGVNFEYDAHRSVCAEQSAVVLARHHGASGINVLAISEWPCGQCRQFLWECAEPDLQIINTQVGEMLTLSELLPKGFDMGSPNGFWTSHSCAQSQWQDKEIKNLLLALNASSYAPYTRQVASLVFEQQDGTRLCGTLLENVAFSVTLTPLHTALVSLLAQCQTPQENPFQHIKTIFYSEISHTTLSYYEASKRVLSTLAPQASFLYFEY